MTSADLSLSRVIKVTGLVALLGAVGGAIGGSLIGVGVGIVEMLHEGFPERILGFLQGVGLIALGAGAVGAAYGMVLGPVYSWTLLRRVPLWRAIIEPAIIAAITVGAVLASSRPSAVMVWGAPVVTSALGALRLRRATYRALAAGGEKRLPPP